MKSPPLIRDAELGLLLAQLTVPEHGAGYWESLELQLAAEQAPARALPRVHVPARWRWLAAATAMIVTAAVALAILGLPGVRQTSPQPATAAEVLAAMNAGVASTRSLSGDVTHSFSDSHYGEIAYRGSFVTAARGDYRVVDTVVKDTSRGQLGKLGQVSLLTFDSATQLVVKEIISTDGAQTYSVVKDASADQPLGPLTSYYGGFLQGYRAEASALRALLAENPRGLVIETTSYQGRPAWKATIKGTHAGGLPNSYRIELIVDRQTGFVLWARWVETVMGDTSSGQVALSSLHVNGPRTTDIFKVKVPPSAKIVPMPLARRLQVRSVPLGKMEALSGLRPLVPTKLPEGYTLRSVVVYGIGPPALHRDGLLLGFRRGFDSFSILLFNIGEKAGLGTPILTAVGLRTTRLTSGALAGSTVRSFFGFLTFGAELELLRKNGEHLIINGDLTRAQMLAVANSLQRYSRE